jgi:hypothetical protein
MKLTSFHYLVIFYFVGIGIYAQNTSRFKIENESINHIIFKAKQVSVINISTHSKNTILFNAASESTYKDELYFDYEIKNNKLFIKSIYPNRLAFGDNKMTSMQEFSVSVEMILPENLTLDITSEIASIEGQGVFKNVIINTKSGHCKLNPFKGNAKINTYDGYIKITTNQADVKAESQTGFVKIDESLVENYYLNLRSVKGNIKVIQTQ